VGTTSRKSVAFPELHLLFGGHLHDAIRDHDVPSGDSAAPFEARHVSARHSNHTDQSPAAAR
jgi:hypothetical protein